MDPVAIGKSAATGWRSKVADAVATPVSRVAPVEPDQVRAAIGATFFLLSRHGFAGGASLPYGPAAQMLAGNPDRPTPSSRLLATAPVEPAEPLAVSLGKASA